MPNYRRAYVPGGTYFFTVKTERNWPIFWEKTAVRMLGEAIREARNQWMFEAKAMVLLPDHFHAIWVLPAGDTKYSTRLGYLKKEFTKKYLLSGGTERATTKSRKANRRRGVWQRRFWEHVIENEHEFDAYFDYIHWNPVKHGYVKRPGDWPHSTFHRWVKAGVYPQNWGCGVTPPSGAANINDAGE